MDDSKRSKRLENVYSARNNRELATTYDVWAEDYEDDMLSLGFAILAVAAGFVGRYVPLRETVLDAVQVPACSEASCACSTTKTLWG